MRKIIYALIPALLILTGCSSNGDNNNTENATQESSKSTTSGTNENVDQSNQKVSTNQEITGEELLTHSDQNSCWTVINGTVYDLTEWASQHPGGPNPILAICGKDGSAMFNMQHNVQTGPNEILSSFKIGSLKK